MNIEIESLIRDIIIHEMDLTDNQVYLYNQDFTLKNKAGSFLAVEFLEDDIIYNNVSYRYSDSGDMYQINHTGMKEMILVHFFSKDKDARIRKVEAIQAIKSLYSEQMQEKYQCKIFQVAGGLFSGKAARTREYSYSGSLEGGVIIYYFSIILACNTWYRKEKLIQADNDYYNVFETQIYDDEQVSQKIADYTLTENGSTITVND